MLSDYQVIRLSGEAPAAEQAAGLLAVSGSQAFLPESSCSAVA